MTITGCNNLISQRFGTHRLRVLSATELAAGGVGDADFLEVTDAELGPGVVRRLLHEGRQDYAIERPLVRRSAPAPAPRLLTAWWPCRGTHCAAASLPPGGATALRGMVTAPRGSRGGAATYLKLGDAPLAWYWNLLLLLGGLGIALLTEGRQFAAKDVGGRPR